jgi:hypothetical protein
VATLEPRYALAEVPGHDDAGAGQQPAEPPRPASRRAGTEIALGDDALARSRTLPYQWDATIGRMMASAPLTIRIDLDSAP